eukprot:11217999-Lingulodinium_polyedra.AAC.1
METTVATFSSPQGPLERLGVETHGDDLSSYGALTRCKHNTSLPCNRRFHFSSHQGLLEGLGVKKMETTLA